MRREHGFSLLELMIAMGIMLTVTASIFTLMNPTSGTFQAQPEVSDMQQRLRVATDTLYKDLVMAGAGAYQGANSGSMIFFFAPVMPFRQGTVNDDPPGTFRNDIITLIYVPPTTAQTSLQRVNGNSLTNSAEIWVNADPGCPNGDPLCSFTEGMTMLMYDESGNYDTFTVTQVQDTGQLKLQHNNDKIQYPNYKSSQTDPLHPAKIVQANYFEYYLNAATNQLMFYDGSGNPDVPIVDNIVGLNFEYYGDPQPPAWVSPTKSVCDDKGPCTTYGPRPVPTAAAPATNPGNCVFDTSLIPESLLPALGVAGSGLVKLTAAQLTDGPWCPTAASVNRWDADLLRIRKIAVTVRVQAANAALRGPAGTLFAKGGTSNGGERFVPDQEIRFEVSPRNLNLGR
jgi:prepilin-type N-terminal cleavage/methylation domain-containing protein